MIKTYYMLTKPGIILGNIITTASGFALASRGHLNYGLFIITLIGLSLVVASAGVFNNYIDRAVDAKMARTKNRALAKGEVSSPNALLFASLLGCLGLFVLGHYTNLLTATIACTGFIIYLVLYAFLKYRSFYGTLVGSLAGAVPPLVGYSAVSNHIDLAAFFLFMIVMLWQMPHFFAIAVYHLDDYTAASIPVLPVVRGIEATKIQMLLYIVAFMVMALMLSISGYTGPLYGIMALLLSVTWFLLCLNGFRIDKNKNQLWGRRMFLYSLAVIMGLCMTMALDVT